MGPGRGRCGGAAVSSRRRQRPRRSTGRSGTAVSGHGVAAQARTAPTRSRSSTTSGASPTPSSTRLAHRAAHVLRARGVGPDARLGIALANRPEWFVAALGRRSYSARSACRSRVARPPTNATYFCADGEVALPPRRSARSPSSSPRSTPRRPSRSPMPRRTTCSCVRTRRARPVGRRRCCARRSTSPPASTVSCATTPRTGSTRPDEVNVTGSPLHHLAGFSGPHSALLLGHTTVLLDHFDAAEWFDAVTRFGGTYSWIAPVHLYRLMTRARGREGTQPTCRRSSACSTDRRRARRASSAR